MSWSEIFLAVIATATLVMALIQVGAIVAVSRVARDAQKTLASVQDDVRPLVAKVNALAEEASRALTAVQDDLRPLSAITASACSFPFSPCSSTTGSPFVGIPTASGLVPKIGS